MAVVVGGGSGVGWWWLSLLVVLVVLGGDGGYFCTLAAKNSSSCFSSRRPCTTVSVGSCHSVVPDTLQLRLLAWREGAEDLTFVVCSSLGRLPLRGFGRLTSNATMTSTSFAVQQMKTQLKKYYHLSRREIMRQRRQTEKKENATCY